MRNRSKVSRFSRAEQLRRVSARQSWVVVVDECLGRGEQSPKEADAVFEAALAQEWSKELAPGAPQVSSIAIELRMRWPHESPRNLTDASCGDAFERHAKQAAHRLVGGAHQASHAFQHSQTPDTASRFVVLLDEACHVDDPKEPREPVLVEVKQELHEGAGRIESRIAFVKGDATCPHPREVAEPDAHLERIEVKVDVHTAELDID